MSSPKVTGRALIAALGKAGFMVARVRGSHHIVKHPDGRMTVVPVHAGRNGTDCKIVTRFCSGATG